MDSRNFSTAWVEIDLDAIAHNIAVIHKTLRPGTRLMLVVKAGAYGHGITEIACRAASCGVDAFAVANLEEGIFLRRAGVGGTILLLNPPERSQAWCDALCEEKIEPTISSENEIRFLQVFCSLHEGRLPVHLKIDTGMSRFGVPMQEAVSVARLLPEMPCLRLASVYSHLAGGCDGKTDQQAERFQTATNAIRSEGIAIPTRHIANSLAVFTRPDLHYDMVRIGLALYGVPPGDHCPIAESLRPAMAMKAKIVHIKTIPTGEGVGYCPQFSAQREMKIGVISAGYVNGIQRTLSGKMNVIISGQTVPQIGSVTMNHLLVDLTTVPQAAVGDAVTLLGEDGGKQITVNDLAVAADTIPWELLCLFGNSNSRRLV